MKRTAVLAVWLVFVACNPSQPRPAPSPSPSPSSGELVVSYPVEPPGLNPYLASTRTIATTDLLRPVMPTLLTVTPDMKYAPGVAAVPRGADVSRDGLRVTFTIDRRARWSDGATLTSSDVEFTWQTIMDTRWPIADRSGYDQIAEVLTPSELKVTLVFKQPYPAWRDLFSAGDFILPRHALEGKEFTNEMRDAVGVTSGPFRITGWQRGLSITYEADPAWWGRPPRLAKVVVQFVPSIDTASRLFEAKRLDGVITTSQVNLDRRLDGDGAKVARSYGGAWWEMSFDAKERGLEFRQAMASATDRSGVVEAMFKGEAKVLNDPIPGRDLGGNFDRYARDPAVAKDLLGRSGLRGDPLVCGDGSSEVAGLFERAIQKTFDDVGVQVDLRNTDAATIEADWVRAGVCDAHLIERRGSPGSTMASRFHSRYVVPNGDNVTGISDGVLDGLLDEKPLGDARVAGKVAELLPVLPLIEVQMVIASRGWSPGAPNATIDGPFWRMGAWTRTG